MKIPPFGLERFFALHEFSAPHHLCASDCEASSIAEVLAFEDGARERFLAHSLGYTESNGAPGLREEIAKIYTTIDPNQVLVHAGGQEAIFTFMNANLRSGDHVVVHYPCYQSLHEVPRAIGCQVDEWRARPENDWRLDLDELRGLLLDNTRLVVVNLPHSPTGYLMQGEEWQELMDLLRGKGILLLADEAYRGLEYEAERRLPAACDLYEGAFSLGLLSKGYGLPGLRIGWLAGSDGTVFERTAAYKDYTTICSSAPSEFLAELALRSGGELLEYNRRMLCEHLPMLDEFFREREGMFRWVRPQAGSVTFPTLLLDETVAEFCNRCLGDAGVLLLPGSLFDPDSREFRIGMGRKDFVEGLGKLAEYLS
ncbi:MAG: aminotransferase class I/II-fold pyridoxal phosphate-dependent enzyme [Planctomycetota bacterium]|jgi:aspartate/methionine/tyrosine aminotransferase